MSGRLKDKIAVVTGASSGIGRAISLAYHKEGARVVCADLREGVKDQEFSDYTHNVITKEGGSAIFVHVDVTVAEQVEALIQIAVEWGGRLDIMVSESMSGRIYLDPRFHVANV